MTTLEETNRYGEELEKTLLLRTSPIAVKFLEKEDDILKARFVRKETRVSILHSVRPLQCHAAREQRWPCLRKIIGAGPPL